MRSTSLPALARAMAKLSARVVLPTPPLMLPTARITVYHLSSAGIAFCNYKAIEVIYNINVNRPRLDYSEGAGNGTRMATNSRITGHQLPPDDTKVYDKHI